jgi:tRNA splicing endonuclease
MPMYVTEVEIPLTAWFPGYTPEEIYALFHLSPEERAELKTMCSEEVKLRCEDGFLCEDDRKKLDVLLEKVVIRITKEKGKPKANGDAVPMDTRGGPHEPMDGPDGGPAVP